jgi:beta-lactam-binding protein with PASTA domain
MATGAFSALRRVIIVIAIAVVFVFGFVSTVFLSLLSPAVTVPEVAGKDRFEAERVLGAAGLNFRVRSTPASNQVQANTVLFQLPRSGEVVKAGQTVAMDISRSANAGEASEVVVPEKSPEEKPANQNETVANENKSKRNKNANANKNANDNANTNTATRNANANRLTTNKNANTVNNVNAAANRNSNRPALNINSNANRSVNQNGGGRPPAPKSSPSVKPQ